MRRQVALLMICSGWFQVADAETQSVTVDSSSVQTAVVELYTSEGCSSCPPADIWLSRLVEVPTAEMEVLALAFHVDYWDYIGWKDRFADPDYTQRQRRLGRANGQSTIYTPEFFVNGQEARGTSSIVNRIQQSNAVKTELKLRLSAEHQDDRLQLKLQNLDKTTRPARFQFVVYENNLSSQVTRGENAGEELHHQRVVRYLGPLKTLEGESSQTIRMHPEWNAGNLGVAALVMSESDVYLQAVYTPLSN